jgi:hypothetical protein
MFVWCLMVFGLRHAFNMGMWGKIKQQETVAEETYCRTRPRGRWALRLQFQGNRIQKGQSYRIENREMKASEYPRAFGEQSRCSGINPWPRSKVEVWLVPRASFQVQLQGLECSGPWLVCSIKRQHVRASHIGTSLQSQYSGSRGRRMASLRPAWTT